MDSSRAREESRAHALCIPSPAQGHINAMLQLAKLLHSRNIRITFVHTLSSYNRILATAGPSSLDGLQDFRFEAIDDGNDDQPSDPVTGKELSSVCLTVRNRLSGSFRRLLERLVHDESGGGPKVSCIVSDTFSSYTLDVAAEFGIPDVSFCSVGACGFWGFFALKELVETGVAPLKSEGDLTNGYLDAPVDWIPGKSMRLRDFPSYVRTTDPGDILLNFCKDESQDATKAAAVIINTLDELEGPVLAAMAAQLPPIYTVGPLNLMCHQIHDGLSVKTIGSSLWEEDHTCFKWLEGRAPASVLYVNFGSLTVLTSKQLIEFAWGLANSGHDFLWVIRPNSTVNADILPREFYSEVGERGLIKSWCPQEQVLKHPAVGGFLTHCGWNSMMESISWGVPMICWPWLGDQQTNCRYACDEWGIGVEMNKDVRREEVKEMVRELLGGEKGVEMRRMAFKWKERATKATQLAGGQSFLNLERVINEFVLPKTCDQ